MRSRVLALSLVTALLVVGTLVAPALAGGPITSGQSVSGSVAGPTYAELWTFTGTVGDRILISAAPTGGTMTTQVRLSNPSNSEVLNTSSNLVDYKLLASGTYTLTIQDASLSHTGTYSLTLLDITSGPLTAAGDLDGGAIASAAVVGGQVNAITDLDAYTFTGTAGSRVILGAVATSGVSFNTTMTLYPPAGGASEAISYGADRLDVQLAASGTYTVVVSDYSVAHTGGYNLSYLNLATGPLTSVSDPEGGPITSAQVVSGHLQTTPDFDAYTFAGAAGDRVVIATAATGGTSTPLTYVYPPGGGAALVSSGSNRLDLQLPASGTYTILIEDNGLNDTGTYDLSLLNVTSGPWTSGSDADGAPLIPAKVTTGQMNTGVDMDAFTFIGNVGDRVVIGGLATGGSGFNTNLTLYPPGGGPPEVITYGGDRLDTRLQRSGTYTVEVEDYALTHTGTYSLSYVNLTTGVVTSDTDPDGGPLASGEVRSGSFQTTPDFDVYRFTVAAGNRVVIDAVPTGGSANPIVSIYTPGGVTQAVNSGNHRVEYQAPTSGTYTLLLEDQGLNDTGTYDVTLLNVTAGPFVTGSDPDGGALTPAAVTTGQMNAGVDMDAYTFTGSQGDRVVLGALATSGSGFNTNLTLYPPGGGPPEVITYGGDRLDTQLLQTGTYTVVVEDYANSHTGTYSLMLLDLTAGPLTSAGDPDGTTIASGEFKTGSFQTTPDFDVYRFTAGAGNRIVIDAVPTGGTPNPLVYIYPPGGGPSLVASANHRVEYQVPAAGTYTLLVEDQGLNDTGTYDLTLLNVNAGPFATATDPDGGPIAPATVVAGQVNQDVDMDAYTFTGAAGDEVLIGAVRVGGSQLNTNVTLYPPDGGPAEAVSYGGDRVEAQLQQSGTYTIVIEDYSNAHPGSYNLTFLDLTSGALTGGGDLDGGALNPGDTKLGQFQTSPDFDAYRFAGAFGDTVRITMTATAGTIVPQLYIYSLIGPSLVTSVQSPYTFVLPATSVYSLVLQDQTMLNTGSYSVNFQKTGGVVGVPGGARVTALALTAATPNPFAFGTDLAFTLPRAGAVTLRVFDVRGSLVRRLAEGRFDAGPRDVRWDGADERGQRVPTGVYWAELRLGRDVVRRKIVRVE